MNSTPRVEYQADRQLVCAAQWSMIQLVHFPSHRGTSFQIKLKDKWRALCKGVKNRHSSRANLPGHLWDKVEMLSKLYQIS